MKRSNILCFGLQYIASILNPQPVLPVAVEEPSTSSEPVSSVSSSCDHQHPPLPVAVGVPSTSTHPESSEGCPEYSHTVVLVSEREPCTISTLGEPKPSDVSLRTPSTVGIPKMTCDFGCQVNTRGTQLMKKSFGTQTLEVTLCDQSSQTDEIDEEVAASDDEVDPLLENEAIQAASPQNDPSFEPTKSDEKFSDDSQSETDESISSTPQEDVKFIVFKQNLHELLKWCPICGAAIRKKHSTTQGTQLFVRLKCINGHTPLWQSQPMIKGMAAGNLLMSSSIL